MRWIHLLAALAPFAVVLLLVAAFAAPPAPIAASAPPEAFSADRALAEVSGLTSTGKPHPTGHYDGSPRTAEEIADHTRARDWVIGRLRDLGLSPSVQRGRACGKRGCLEVENVIAHLDGSHPGPAVMLAAHYDSTPFGPGAADDGAGVATVLETLRALKTGPQPRRPLIVLIDDGEEMGLLGAKVFVNEHPWAKDVGVVVNVEARGSSGQVAMFETSDGNGPLISLFAGAVRRPVASSVIFTLYKRLPNDTDLSIFKQAGLQGLNFAFADHVYNYHTANDTVAELDPRSLQHMGDQALTVSRALLEADALPTTASDAVYFDLFSLALIRYPAGLSFPLSVAATAAAAIALALALRKRRTSPGRIAGGSLLALGSLVVAGVASLGLGALLKKIRFPDIGTGPSAMRLMVADRHALFPWLALVALGFASATAFALWLCPRAPADASKPEHAVAERPAPGRRADALALSFGLLVVWTAFALATGWTAPGASYLFVWPLFGLTAGVTMLVTRPAPTPWQRAAAVILAALPAAIVWLPILRVLLTMVGATVPPATSVPVALLGVLLTPLLVESPRAMKWALPLAGAAIMLASTALACALGT